MKTRNGFVSNSSSTSFSIYGIHTEYFSDKYDDRDKMWDVLDGLVDKAEANNLQLICDEEGSAYLGLSWNSIGDDETGKQFKERAENAVKLFLKENKIKIPKAEAIFEDHTDSISD